MNDALSNPQIFQIRMRGKLDEQWASWFGGMTIVFEVEDDNTPVTTLTGPIDQAALRGVLSKIWDLNLTVISVAGLDAGEKGKSNG